MNKPTFYITGLFKALPLAIKLFVSSIKFCKPFNFSEKFSFGLRKGCAGLSCFVETIKPFINFSTDLEQQREIIFYIVWVSKLIECAFDRRLLEPNNFRKIIFENKKNDDPTVQKITTTVHRIKELTLNNPLCNNFLENLVKTWETHAVRDFKRESNMRVSEDEALQAAENRGNFYFCALIYALNPENLNQESKNMIRLSGSWFQIIDDYSDRKKDSRGRNKRNTPFTVSQNKSFERFMQYTTKYQEEIQILLGKEHALIRFMKDLSVLWPALSQLSNWHPDYPDS